MALRIASTALVLALACASAAAREAGWRTYVNPRFGVSVTYPSAFALRDAPPANGDGQGFRTADGEATLTVFGSYNVDTASPAQLMASYKDAGVAYTYAKAAGGWFVLSGTDGGRITYLRCNLGAADVVGCARMVYPAAAAGAWSAAVDRVSRTLRVAAVRVE